MQVAINDLSFRFPFYEKKRFFEKLNQFIDICQFLESGRCHRIEHQRLTGTVIDTNQNICQGSNLSKLIREFSDRDRKRYLLGLLTNRGQSKPVAFPFVFHDLASDLCAQAKDDAVVSLESRPEFNEKSIEGAIRDQRTEIRNIARWAHTEDYRIELGIRKYEANIGKHKPDKDHPYGKGKVASRMDLDDVEAQELLDQAIEIKDRLYARKENRNYAFQESSPGIYHGYIAEDLPDDIQRTLAKSNRRTRTDG